MPTLEPALDLAPQPLVAVSEGEAAVILRAIDELHRTEPGARGGGRLTCVIPV